MFTCHMFSGLMFLGHMFSGHMFSCYICMHKAEQLLLPVVAGDTHQHLLLSALLSSCPVMAANAAVVD